MPKFSELTGQLGQKWQELDPILKTTLLATGAGGVAGGILGSMGHKPTSEEGRKARRNRIIGNAGLAAILAGGATAGLGYGMRNLSEVMPKGSLAPGEAASKAVSSWQGRSIGAAALPSSVLGWWNRKSPNLAAIAAEPFGESIKELMGYKGKGRTAIEHYLGKTKGGLVLSAVADSNRLRGQTALFNALRDNKAFGHLDRQGLIEEAVSAGADIDPALLDQSKLMTKIRKLPVVGKIPAAIRRAGPARLGGLSVAGALLPEIWGGVNTVGHAMFGGGEE